MADLYSRLCNAATHNPGLVADPKTEADLQNRVRVEYNKTGGILWRNNVGAVQDSHGNFFRYGLANDSKGMSEVIKSADLIGIRPTTITRDMVGTTLGRYVSYEVKAPGWTPSRSNKREKAQMAWATLINSMGGDARIISSVDQIW